MEKATELDNNVASQLYLGPIGAQNIALFGDNRARGERFTSNNVCNFSANLGRVNDRGDKKQRDDRADKQGLSSRGRCELDSLLQWETGATRK